MKFFILGTDEIFTNYPKLKSWFGKIDDRKFNFHDAYKIPKRQILAIDESENTVFTSIVDRPFPMVSAEVKAVFDMYDSHIIYKEVVLLDGKNEKAGIYYIPILPEVDCLDESSVFNLNKSLLKRGVIDYERTEGKAIFRLAGVGHYYMVGRLDLVESILKRNVIGIGLNELEVKEQEER
ncbi:hypothetical protein IMSAGC005_03124 [Lachnospiraceae bacterium]|nr:hypothetical protein IMSAGC005_03124 [Lachnospiraceae bacterium]